MNGDVFLSDEIATMMKEVKDDIPALALTNKSTERKPLHEQFTNRQLIILFEELLDVSLYSGGANINAFCKLVGLVSGKSPGGIRNQIPQEGLNYKDDEQTKRDAEYVASCIESISPTKANRIRENVE